MGERRLDGFVRDLVTHEVAEEQLVLPPARERLGRGGELAELAQRYRLLTCRAHELTGRA